VTDSDLLDSWPSDAERASEGSLRPRKLEEFVGQARIREQLGIVLESARRRGLPPDHLLFSGPPGLGKTSLAAIVAAELGVGFRVTSGPALERAGDLAAILTGLEPGDVLFVDEIHRLPRAVEEVLYPAMEDFQIDVVLGKGPGARSLRLDLHRFTLVAATTRTGLITSPLRDRFGFSARLDYYGPADLQAIVTRSAAILGVAIDQAGAEVLARRSRGTPRIANRLLRRVRDYAEVRADGSVDEPVAEAALELFEVDRLGLDKLDLALLRVLCERFGGAPVGLATLAVSVGEEQDTVEDVAEPYLLQLGFLQRTPRGRVATAAAFAHLGLDLPRGTGAAPAPGSLFDGNPESDCRRIGTLGGPESMEGSGSLVILVLMVGVFYFLLIRPQQRRLKSLQSLQSSLTLGDEVVTSAGFFGTIRRFDGDVVTIELSPGVEARVSRRAISGKVNPEPAGEVAEVADDEERPDR
jgi:Holliday junction DNA helicase RuvB